MDELAKKMADLAEQYGPHVVEATRGAAWMEALSNLVASCLVLLVAVFLAVAGRWLWRKASSEELDEIAYGAALACFGIAAILGPLGLLGLIDPWLWATFQNPDLWIAKKVLGL